MAWFSERIASGELSNQTSGLSLLIMVGLMICKSVNMIVINIRFENRI